MFFFVLFKDRKNTNNANLSADEIDAEIGEYQLPLTLAPFDSSTLSPHIIPSNELSYQHTSSTSAIPAISSQCNVVLHSDINEPLLPKTNRFDLNLPLDKSYRNQLNRKANSLMTVYEQSSLNESASGDSTSKPEGYRARSPSSMSDLAYRKIAHVHIVEKDPDERVNK